MRQFWVKKLISKKEWLEWYEAIRAYCHLGEEGIGREKKVKMGFLNSELCSDCVLLNDDELRQVDNYRKANNIFPRPLEDCSKPKETEGLNF